jgi:subtilisin family serine protease
MAHVLPFFSPGTLITSASALNDTSFRVLSGTSMSAPHVTGAVALYLQKDPTLTPAQIRAALLKDASKGQLMWIFNRLSPNKLLFTGGI